MRPRPLIALLAAASASLAAARAGEATVEAVAVVRADDGRWRFDVTVAHADEGWDHYADAFTVEGEDGEVLARRVLAHPHVDEQPFTRSLRGVAVPQGTRTVWVRAHDSVHGPGEAVRVALKR